MTNEEFMKRYDEYLSHAWVSSEEASKRAEQIKRQKEYNHQYYLDHPEKWGIRNQIMRNKIDLYVSQGMSREDASRKVAQEAQRATQNEKKAKKEAQKSPLLGQMQDSQIKNAVDAYMKSHPNSDRESVEARIKSQMLKQHFADQFEELDLDTRNQRMMRTYINQGEMQKASELAKRQIAADKRQQQTLSRRSASDTAASEAQDQAARSRTYKRKADARNIAVSNAQAQAAKTARQNRTLRRQSASNTAASIAQASAAKSRSKYAQSIEGRVNRSISRATKKVSDTINKGKAAVQKVKDTINNTSAAYQRIKKNTQNLLSRYFG